MISVVPAESIGLTFDDSWSEAIGLRGTVSWSAHLKDVFIPYKNVMGQPGDFIQKDPYTYECSHAAHLVGCTQADVTFERSEGWSFFDDRVCPNELDWRRITDREQLERLRAEGVDVAGELMVAHAFYGPRSGLQHVLDRLALEGFESMSWHGNWLVLARTHRLSDASKVSVALLRFSSTLGVAYDGWKLA